MSRPTLPDTLPRSVALANCLDDALPQTQCRQCGYDGCRPYAEAIARGEAINRCPPGGDTLIATLARMTGRPVVALDPECGAPRRLETAQIDERACIGCTLCIDACPVDAIVGAAKRMHTVLPALCTGCALCVPACPVDCIAMVPAGRGWSVADAYSARERCRTRERRLASIATEAAATVDAARARRQATVAAALARARRRRADAGAGRG